MHYPAAESDGLDSLAGCGSTLGGGLDGGRGPVARTSSRDGIALAHEELVTRMIEIVAIVPGRLSRDPLFSLTIPDAWTTWT